MKILVVWYEDDNFGDNLIRICFERLLEVVFQNLGIPSEDCHICGMPLKKIDLDLIRESDAGYFAGGGLFGLSYLNFFDYLDEITRAADEWGIPVIFSSVGINNMDATPDTEQRLVEILQRKCIVAASVRENLDLFKCYAKDVSYDLELVADPATWTQFVYAKEIENIKKSGKVGINVVRGGLFRDNNKEWALSHELAYLNNLREKLDRESIPYRFFTNGSFLDSNALKYYAKENSIPEEQVVLPDCTREFVEAVAEFDFVVAIRMHSSIVSYALQVPSINLVWNDKIPFFYQNIGMPDRAIAIEDWNVDHIIRFITEKGDEQELDQEFLMSLYRFLYRSTAKLFHIEVKDEEMYKFDEICASLREMPNPDINDVDDLRLKIGKGQNHYLARFEEVKRLKKEITQNKKKIKKLQKELDQLNNRFIIRLLRKFTRFRKKLSIRH